MSLPKPFYDAELETQLRRIVETIQAKRLSIFNDDDGSRIPTNHPKHDLWMDLLDVEYYALEALQEMGCMI